MALWRNDLMVAVRKLLRDRGYSVITIGGLARGLAGCLLILGHFRIALTPTPFALAGIIALVIVLATVTGHALRVARHNPVHALRYE